LLASIGSAVGLGNIWRFPYIFNKAGGSSFLIPYLVSIIIFGIPLMILEFASGRRFKASISSVFEKLNKRSKIFGLFAVAINFFTLSYYMVIVGWVLGYFVESSLLIKTEFSSYINSAAPTIFSFLALLISSAIVYFGIEKGIERFSKIFMPLFFAMLILILAFVLSLPKSIDGILNYFKPDFAQIKNADVWLLAASQSLFSLSLGVGIMITYGSYLSKKENIPKQSVIIALADTLIALTAGMIIFGFLYASNEEIASGSKLAFETMPKIFSSLSIGMIMQPMFFFLLFIAGLTSAISMQEVVVSTLMEEFNFTRRKSSYLTFFLLAFFSIFISLNYSGRLLAQINLLETFDYIFGSMLLVLSAAISCLVLAWNWNTKELLEEVDIRLENISRKLDAFIENDVFLVLIRYIAPTLLITLFLLEIGFIRA